MARPPLVVVSVLLLLAMPLVPARQALSFEPPKRLGELGGYEPGVKLDAAGNVYVTAHKLNLTNEGTRLASWLWVSRDGGDTFEPLEHDLLAPATNAQWGAEADLALDAAGNLYVFDTTGADGVFSKWSDAARKLEHTRPLAGTAAPVDDRPWLAASGDGLVYYLANTGRGSWFHRSTDGGVLFGAVPIPGTEENGFCTLASEVDGPWVYFVCDRGFGGREVLLYRSGDRGLTFQRSTIATRAVPQSMHGFTTIAVDDAGGVHVAYSMGAPYAKTFVHLLSSLDHGATWRAENLTPYLGSFEYTAIAAGPKGTVAVLWYGSSDEPRFGHGDGHAYRLNYTLEATIVEGAGTKSAKWTHAAVTDGPVSRTGSFGLGDFFQAAFAPDGRLHVAFGMVPEAQPDTCCVTGGDVRVMFARQAAGPNLED